MRWLGGHLGTEVSALVDGQLRPAEAERAWGHVLGCVPCRAAVERERWVKSQVSLIGQCEPPPPARRDGGLVALPDPSFRGLTGQEDEVAFAWAAVGELERRHRVRRGGLIAAGAGTVSAAVIGLAAASGAVDVAEPRSTETTIGGVPTRAPVTAPSGSGQQGSIERLSNRVR